MRSGTLYEADKSKSGQLSIRHLVFKLKTVAWILRKAGALLILLAVISSFWLYIPLAIAEIGYTISNFQFPISNEFFEPKPAWVVPDTNYSLYIPKIQAVSKVVPNVSLNSPSQYLEALRSGVAAAAGLSRPGQVGTTYLFAHSTDSPINFARYNAVFYLLDKLVYGDAIEVVYKNKLQRYRVTKIQVLAAGDTRYLVPQDREELLVLQTCYPPGTSWKRLVVEAKPVY